MTNKFKEMILNVLEWWLMMLPFLLLIGWWAGKVFLDTSCGGLALQ